MALQKAVTPEERDAALVGAFAEELERAKALGDGTRVAEIKKELAKIKGQVETATVAAPEVAAIPARGRKPRA